jgi:hypothetical protein
LRVRRPKSCVCAFQASRLRVSADFVIMVLSVSLFRMQ